MDRMQPVTLLRAVEATQIPSGSKVVLPEGAWVTVQQILGGNLTALTDRGGLVRIAAEDAGALGDEWVEASRKAAAAARPGLVDASAPVDEARVREVLGTVYDPEIPASIVELGLVYLTNVEPLADGGYKVIVRMTLTAPGCGIGTVLLDDVRGKLGALPGVKEVDVDLVFDPPWDPSMMSEAARLQLGFM